MLCLIFSDAHLHLNLLDTVDRLMTEHPDWHCVSLGDWSDDWGRPVEDYQRFFDALVDFAERYADRFHPVWGNHDYGYWDCPARCSGYTADARDIVRSALHKVIYRAPITTVYRAGNVLFSHAGLSKGLFDEYKRQAHKHPDDSFLYYVNSLRAEELWRRESPLWYRPTHTAKDTFNSRFLQVVGHTPVPTIKADPKTNVLYTDTWSTFSDRTPIGDCSLVLVNTVTATWEIL